MADSPVLERVRALVAPIASDLQLGIYDIEQRGGTLRITLEGKPGEEPINLEQLALATRLISREFDHTDPIPGKYMLEVSSPGIERVLRTPEHFARAVGETVSIRLVGPDANGQRRFEGTITSADGTSLVLLTDAGERTLPLAQVERAKTTFDWSPAPKPGKGPKKAKPTAAGPGDDQALDDDLDDDDLDLEDLDEGGLDDDEFDDADDPDDVDGGIDDDPDSDSETETP